MAILNRIRKVKSDRAIRSEMKKYKRYQNERLSRNIHVCTAETSLQPAAIKTIRLVCRNWQDTDHFILLGSKIVMVTDAPHMTAEEYLETIAEMSLIAEGDRSFSVFRLPKHYGIRIDGRVSYIMPVNEMPLDEEGRYRIADALQYMNSRIIDVCRKGEVLAFVKVDRSGMEKA